jgi:hypothetical protein
VRAVSDKMSNPSHIIKADWFTNIYYNEIIWIMKKTLRPHSKLIYTSSTPTHIPSCEWNSWHLSGSYRCFIPLWSQNVNINCRKCCILLTWKNPGYRGSQTEFCRTSDMLQDNKLAVFVSMLTLKNVFVIFTTASCVPYKSLCLTCVLPYSTTL